MAMDEIFCLHCHRYHPREDMVLVKTRAGPRWRCRKSIKDGKLQKKRSVPQQKADQPPDGQGNNRDSDCS